MKIQCTYSGLEFTVPGFHPAKLILRGKHPLIDANQLTLLQLLPDYLEDRMKEEEKRLFFVALLNSTGLVDFKTAAQPSLATIAKSMEYLLKVISWGSEAAKQLSLPRYVVNRENAGLTNIRRWIDAWNEAKSNWLGKKEWAEERTAFLIREEALYRLIRSSFKKADSYHEKLARHALEASNAPHALLEFWTSIFKAKELEIFSLREVDIQELYDHLADNLDVTTSLVSQTALRHIEKLLTKNKQGITHDLDLFSEEEELANFSDQGKPYRILTKMERLQRSITIDAPMEEPKEDQFRTKVEYLVARAKFGVRQAAISDAQQRVKEAAGAQQKLTLQLGEEEAREESISVTDLEYETVMNSSEYDISQLIEDVTMKQRETIDSGNDDKVEEI